ncbi:alanine racemase [Moraxella sp.]|uniref:alanine racemase n=1 Tax=Moraxella sp. TaxID=479 RepID=UPI0026DC50EB|nr:alanine racemase [Moraxella sp.]MDO4894273.1 alanine racemase [Moraxella sp.]
MKKSAISMAMALSLGLTSLPVLAAPNLTFHGQTNSSVNKQTANAWLEIDTQAFGNNLAAMKRHLNGKAKICAILKADAYGNGIDVLMPTIIEHQIPCIGIGTNEEARIARLHGYQGIIMRVRSATLAEIQDGVQYQIEELLGNLQAAKAVSEYAKQTGQHIRYHLSLNSGGMNRNGIELSGVTGKAEALEMLALDGLTLSGLMTHFPVEDKDDVKKGLEIFKKQTDWLINTAKLNRHQLIIHAANSFVTLEMPEGWFDMVRPGGIIYGEPVYDKPEYEYIMSFKTRVASVNFYPKGSTVGYDRTHTLQQDSYLANLPMGYSDGYRRVFSNKGHVLIGGHKVPVVGKVSMNTTMVDVTAIHDKVKAGDEVVIFGKQGKEQITQAEVEEINDALLADLYTIWGNSNPKFAK